MKIREIFVVLQVYKLDISSSYSLNDDGVGCRIIYFHFWLHDVTLLFTFVLTVVWNVW
jgi:hypothetical protein